MNKQLAIIGTISVSFMAGTALSASAADLNYFYDPSDIAANNSLNAANNALNVINYYEGLQGDLSTEAETIITETFSNLSNYMGTDGLTNAINAGFRPFTPIFRGHGVHYVKPLDILNPPVATDPLGLNFDEHGNLVAAYYFQEQYLVDESGTGFYNTLEGVEPNELLSHYQNFKQNYDTSAPDIFEVFGSLASWHTHNGVKIDNIGSLDSEAVIFDQDLSDEEWVSALLAGLADDDIDIAIYEEPDPSQYPFYNTLMTPGFHMIHIWLGAENQDGLFAGTHDDVAPNAVDEHGGHGGHGDGGHGDHGDGEMPPESQEPVSVPEPSTLVMLATSGLFGLISALKLKSSDTAGKDTKKIP
ncbi:MAG: PEP-CTERM sorting domain-containing protein [Crocosphaera sp.]|nr:PEP-CTERM sorting domain-containing protein [Crocosphaera sp.]